MKTRPFASQLSLVGPPVHYGSHFRHIPYMAMFVTCRQLPEIMNKHEGLLGAIYGVPLP
jgi:hypothetical protein